MVEVKDNNFDEETETYDMTMEILKKIEQYSSKEEFNELT